MKNLRDIIVGYEKAQNPPYLIGGHFFWIAYHLKWQSFFWHTVLTNLYNYGVRLKRKPHNYIEMLANPWTIKHEHKWMAEVLFLF